MKTVFKLEGEGNKLPFAGDSERVEKFKLFLPSEFHLIEEDNEIIIEIESQVSEDEQCQSLVDRELDRYFFLTCEKISAKMVHKKKTLTCNTSWRILADLPDNIHPQNWGNNDLHLNKLSLQLRLWSLADDTNNKLTKLLLWFQIIELSYPIDKYKTPVKKRNYPQYKESAPLTKAPNPRSECKFIRHLITHSGTVDGGELKLYCTHLGMPEIMLDVTNESYYEKITSTSKLKLMSDKAKETIDESRQKLNQQHA